MSVVLKDKDKLLDEFSIFILKYKNHIEPENRFMANALLENIFELLHWYQNEISRLEKDIQESKEISNINLKDKIEANNKFKNLKNEIENLLNIPFEGKSNIEAHERLGQDSIVTHIIKEIIPKYEDK